jgi:predicted dehydrogenase/L-amino acid N-acyltransferase YncA
VRVAVLGQGSIGRRHTAILRALGHEVAVYDPSPALAAPPGVTVVASACECLRAADAAVIASPSNEHVSDARRAIELGVPVLVEKPLALDVAHAAELDCLAQARGVMLSVAMSMREHAGVRALAASLAKDTIGPVLRASAWCGSWLPGWRHGSDYRDSYSARAQLGGGVFLDVAVHELDYLLWLLGPARAVGALARHVSALETDVEDVALIVLELAAGGVAAVDVDCFDRSYTRGCRIVGAGGTLEWSWQQERLTHHDATGASHERAVSSDVASAYRRQLQRFLAAVSDGAPAPVPAAEARHVLALLDAARAASRDGRRRQLAPAVSLRAVRRSDAELLRAWRNDPETRRWSRSSAEVTAEEHAEWLQRALADDSVRLWIAEAGGSPVGHVRVTPVRPPHAAQVEAEVHVNLAPQARGRGLGAALLVQAAACALAEPGRTRLCAYVKPEHEASLRAFAHAGFRRSGAAEDGLLRLERSPANG